MRKVTVTSLFTSEDFQALALTSDNWANERRAQVGLQFIGSRIWCTISLFSYKELKLTKNIQDKAKFPVSR